MCQRAQKESLVMIYRMPKIHGNNFSWTALSVITIIGVIVFVAIETIIEKGRKDAV